MDKRHRNPNCAIFLIAARRVELHREKWRAPPFLLSRPFYRQHRYVPCFTLRHSVSLNSGQENLLVSFIHTSTNTLHAAQPKLKLKVKIWAKGFWCCWPSKLPLQHILARAEREARRLGKKDNILVDCWARRSVSSIWEPASNSCVVPEEDPWVGFKVFFMHDH